MKKLRSVSSRSFSVIAVLVLILSSLAAISAIHPAKAVAATLPTYRYTKYFDNTNSGSVYAEAVTTDPSGNVYVAGNFMGTVGFDGVGGSDDQTMTNQSVFLTRYNANGTYGWTKIFDTSSGSSYVQASGLATDSQGDVYLTGSFDGTVAFNGLGGSDSKTQANVSTFLTKYNANGTYGYTKILDTSGPGGYAQGLGVAVDKHGNIYLGGTFSGQVVFDGPGGSDTITSGNDSGFLTKYDSSGTYQWTKYQDTTNGAVYGQYVAVDGSGDVYVSGYFSSTVIFDGPGGSDSQDELNGSSYVTKYNANGTYGWTQVNDTPSGFSNNFGVAVDSNGNVYTTGTFYNTVTFDGPGGHDTQTQANGSTFLTKYSTNGSYDYTKFFDASASSSFSYPNSLTVDSLGDVYIQSGFAGTVIFDGPGGSDSQTNSGITGAITKINANGSYAWTKIYPTTSGTDILAEGSYGDIAADDFGNIYSVGYFTGPVDFGGGDVTAPASNYWDAFITSYAAFIPPVIPDPTPSTPVAVSPTAPNTGFGIKSDGLGSTIAIYSIEIIAITAVGGCLWMLRKARTTSI